MAKYQTKKKPNPYLQISSMRSLFPQFTIKKKSKTEVEFVGELRPKENMPSYKVLILYRGNLRPHVKVLDPLLVEKPPHFYSKSKTLCLYHPKDFNWTHNKLIAKHIVPITSAWIYFYEVWLECGKWYGPEAKHSAAKE